MQWPSVRDGRHEPRPDGAGRLDHLRLCGGGVRGWLWLWLLDRLMTRIIVIVVLLIALGYYWMDSRDNRLQDEIDKRDTIERMQDAIDPNIDDSGVVDWLRDFAK